jgi:mono/diheme cytochrome c family protein
MCIHPADGLAGLRVRRVAAALAAAALATMFLDTVARAQGYPARFELGTTAAGQDIAPIDIAVPADGKGLPPGSGDYAKGKAVYETACAACHGADLMGVAGLPNMPNGAQLRLIAGRGTLASKNPVLTVESYWPYATTLFDYVRRAMPFSAPGSLRARSTPCVPTSWRKARSSRNRPFSTPRRCPASPCPTATASFPTRARRCSGNATPYSLMRRMLASSPIRPRRSTMTQSTKISPWTTSTHWPIRVVR